MKRGLNFWLMIIAIVGGMTYLTYRIQGAHEAIVWLIGITIGIGIILLIEKIGKRRKKDKAT